jgi:hypothetical protein
MIPFKSERITTTLTITAHLNLLPQYGQNFHVPQSSISNTTSSNIPLSFSASQQ